jgi:tetratricopeptide (TPR) repeat protein
MTGLASGSYRLFRVAGITVFLHWSWLAVAYFEIVMGNRPYQSRVWNLAEYLTLFAIVLLHEFGHALACRQVGGRTEQIVLWPLGGLAYVSPPPRPGAWLWSTAAGPLVNVVLLPVTLVLCQLASNQGWSVRYPDAYHYLQAVGYINLGLLIVNLLPIYPLDGGQILHALLWPMLGRGRSLQAASFLGLLGGGALVVLAVSLGFGWLAVVAAFIALGSLGGLHKAQEYLRTPGRARLDDSLTHLHNRSYAEAVAASSQALDEIKADDPATRANAYLHRGAAHAAGGDHDRAVQDYTESLRLAESPCTYLARAEAHLLSRAYEQAVADLTEALRLDPKLAPAFAQRGAAYLLKGEPDKAITDLTQALRLDGELPGVHANRGNAYLLKGDYEHAVTDFTRALRREPHDACLYANRGNAYRRLGQHERAIADCTTALEIDPQLTGAYCCRGDAHFAVRSHEQAIADYSEVLRRDPSAFEVFNQRGVCQTRLGRHAEAVADFDAALRLRPTRAEPYYNRGLAHRRQNLFAQAAADYAEALRHDPGYADAANNLAWLLATCPDAKLRDGRQAVAHATRACQLSEWQKPHHMGTLAAAYAEVGDYLEAVRWQQKALEFPEYRKSQGEKAQQRLRLFKDGMPYHEGEPEGPAVTADGRRV